jgi:4-hydroxy-2-oxoheptanedioate aldolase
LPAYDPALNRHQRGIGKMAGNMLKKRLQAGKACVNGWLAIPSGFSAETMAQCGWDSVTVDMQHGVQDYHSMVACFQAMDKHPITPLVRVPWNEPGIVGKVLDGGAWGVICPMINNAALDVPGISGIYIGPSDLGLSLGLAPRLDREEPQVLAIYDKLLAATKKRNQFAGLHNGTPGYAAKMIGKGFRFVTIANDSGLMAMAARNAVAQTRKEAGEVAAR